MNFWRRALAATGLLALACSAGIALAQEQAPAQAPEANLAVTYRDAGRDAFRDKQYEQAVRYLHLARFLSLENPRLHLEILARLALAEDAAKNAQERDRTLARFLVVEGRFEEFEAASLEPDVRQSFWALLQQRYDRAHILEVPALAAQLGLIPAQPARVATPTPLPRSFVVTEAPPAHTPPHPAAATSPAASPSAIPRFVPSATPFAPTAAVPTQTSTLTPPPLTATRTATIADTPTRTATAAPPLTATRIPPTGTLTPRPPTATLTSTRTSTPRPHTPTATRVPPTATSTSTPTPFRPSATPTPFRPSATPTLVPATSTRTFTLTPTLVPPTTTSTRTFTPTSAPPTRTSTPTPTALPPTSTSTHTPTRTATPTPTRPSATPTSLPPTATSTTTNTPTPRPPTATLPRPSAAPTSTSLPVRFVQPEQVDTPPVPITEINPVYPERALKERVRGLVILRVLVSEDGLPVRVSIDKAAREDLTQAAIEAAQQWRFQPARKDGRPVRTFAILRFPFEGVEFARTPLGAPTETPTATVTPTARRGLENWRERTPRS